jgi:hypothetical protein
MENIMKFNINSPMDLKTIKTMRKIDISLFIISFAFSFLLLVLITSLFIDKEFASTLSLLTNKLYSSNLNHALPTFSIALLFTFLLQGALRIFLFLFFDYKFNRTKEIPTENANLVLEQCRMNDSVKNYVSKVNKEQKRKLTMFEFYNFEDIEYKRVARSKKLCIQSNNKRLYEEI